MRIRVGRSNATCDKRPLAATSGVPKNGTAHTVDTTHAECHVLVPPSCSNENSEVTKYWISFCYTDPRPLDSQPVPQTHLLPRSSPCTLAVSGNSLTCRCKAAKLGLWPARETTTQSRPPSAKISPELPFACQQVCASNSPPVVTGRTQSQIRKMR